MTSILKGRSFASIATLLNNYIDEKKKHGREEKVAPNKAIVAQLQHNVEVLSKTCSGNKYEIVKTTFRRLLEEQLRLWEKAQKTKDAHRAQLNDLVC